jgi:AAA+ superfamily predicted ATPase
MKTEDIEPVEILHKLIELKPMKHDFDMEDEPETTQNTVPTDIDASNAKLINKHIRQLIKHPLFESYCLSQQDVMVIADLWQFHLELPGRGSSWISICSSAKIRRYQVTKCLKYITGLLERNIICFDEKITGNYYLNPMILQFAEYTLSNDIILRIMGRDIREDLELVLKESWQDDKDFISDLRQVFDLCYNSFGELGSRSPVLEYPILSACLNLLKDRILAAPNNLGINALVRQNGLNEDQLFIILVVMYHQLFCDDRITEADLSLSLAPDPRFKWLQQQLLSDDSVLISSGLISREQRYHRSQVNTLGIPYEILKSLGYSPNTSDEITMKISSFFQKCQPKQTINDVIISAEDKQLISQIITKCRSDKRRDMENWGFTAESNKQGVVLLLYGAPGTGKTFTAGAIANELHRDLVTLNIPELRNKYYGETEKLIKKAFCEMREMASKDSNAPIFLLNEADQLIHKRIASTSTCSTIENSIQSIILEELESFPGILILTTNLESNLDEAFFRRFDLKFRFKLPDLDSRRNLWRMYLRKEIPGSEAIDIDLLAQKYLFSGAQIAMVVQNACIEAITRNGKSKRLYLQDLLKYADLEEPWGNKVCKSIGF